MLRNFFISLMISAFPLAVVHAAKIDTIEIYSKAMHKNIKCVIVLPNEYATGNMQYPTLYMLHGYSDNYSAWVQKAPALIKAVDQYGIIAICPDGGFSSWYFDSPIDSTYQYETFVSTEVPEYVDKHYRTKKNRKYRALAGLSMGGHGAMYIAIKHKSFFGACSSMSGGVNFTPFPQNWDIAKRLGPYEHNRMRWQQNTVQYLVGTLKNNELAISFECGVDDFFIGVNRALHLKLTKMKIDHDYTERPGAHNWMYWNNAIGYQLLFIHRFFERG